MNQELLMNPNCLVAALEKPAAEFTKADTISFIQKNNIRMVNFMYPAADGRLKTLNFVINNAAYLDAILTCGERVDGSSLFPFIEAGSRPVCSASFPYRFCRSVCRNTDTFDALFFLQ